MLKSVHISNYALVAAGEMHFDAGLNILTGETGAGKSILIGAIGALLGERVSASLARSGDDKAVMEAHFDINRLPQVQQYLREQELASDDHLLIIRREILPSGRSRTFINDTPVTLDQVEAVAARLVDLHGQHEHQSLLRSSEHLYYLDAFGGLIAQRRTVRQHFDAAEACRRELEALQEKQQLLLQKKDYLAFQLEEIRGVNPQAGEEDELLAEEKRLAHSSELSEACQKALDLLYERDESTVSTLGAALRLLEDISEYDAGFADVHKELDAALIAVDEAAKTLQSAADRIEINPERLEEVRQRLAAFMRLKKKYAPTIDAVIEQQELLLAELAQVESIDEQLRAAQGRWQQAKSTYAQAALELSQARQQAAGDLVARVPGILAEIGMPGSRFEVEFSVDELADGWLTVGGKACRALPTGVDRVEFMISANPGHPTKPLAKVVSGGEISRIMLALKSLIAREDRIPVLIFDEIDIGISGRVAQAVGKLLRQLAGSHQIICITHLPQIASAGNSHFLVEKEQTGTSTATRVRKLSPAEREHAIALLISGASVTDTHLESARELIEQARQN